jgi:hypothetical protein
MTTWPDKLFDLIYIPATNDKLDELSGLAETECWDYQNTPGTHYKPILFNYIQYTYARLATENKITISDDGQYITFNTGLVTNCWVSTDWISYNYLKAQHLIAGCKAEIIELLASDQEKSR